jgi:uncharacterized protein
MIFEIIASHPEMGIQKKFSYDNTLNILKDEDGNVFEYPERRVLTIPESKPFSKDSPLKKSKAITTIKIQLGLSCNYSCDYCSQRFVERPPETSKKDIEDFMKKLDILEFDEEKGLRIEFWGGEPLVYWKTLKPLAEAFAERFAHWKNRPSFGMVTNGSLLTKEICSWLYYMNFGVGISHDGPGQHVRGPDPFDDPEKKAIILEFYKIMAEQGRISFNTMMNRHNTSRKEIYEWFVKETGIEDVRIGEGSFIDAYDEAAIDNSLNTFAEHFEYRRTAFNDIYSTNGKIGFQNTLQKVDSFIVSLLNHFGSTYVGQKCGMEDENTIAIDLKGNVVTCQNVSIMETGKNGEPHLGGNLSDYDNVSISTATHWKNRANCSNCPVIHICRGSCMYLDGEYWNVTCNSAFSDSIPIFALAFARVTNGFIPVKINSDVLPPDRQDIWGTLMEHKEVPKKKQFPIKVVVEKAGVINDVEVYGKSKLENT